MRSLFYLKKYFIKYKNPLFLGVFCIAVSNVFSIIIPQYVGKVFDLMSELKDFVGTEAQDEVFRNRIFTYGLIILGAACVKGLFTFFMRQTVIVTSRKIEFDLKNEIYQHYQKLSASFYKRNKTGDIINRISEDVGKVRMFLGPAVMYSINLFILLIFVLSKMISVSPILTLYTVLPLPFLSVTIYLVSNKIHAKSLTVQKALSGISNIAQESFAGIRFIKSYTMEKDLSRLANTQFEEYTNEKISLARIQSLFFPLMILLIGSANLLVIYFGGKEVIAGRLTMGIIPEFLIYVNMLTWPVASIGWVSALTYTAAASQDRINEFLETVPDIENTSSLEHTFKGGITFDNVHFTYAESGVEAIKGLSFSISPGQSLGIMGKTGSGKSTIPQLIARMYDVTKGEIRIDDIPLQEHNLYDLRESMSYVPQDVFLFSDSIANNIGFGVDTFTRDEIEHAAQRADVLKNIQDFKKGFDTVIGERGISLSGGQKQRISLARAFMKPAQILLLDDCLSAVDTETEQNIIRSIREEMQHTTTLIISHRVSSVQHADQILVLEHGKPVELGTHQELISAGGYYQEVYEKQQADTSK